MAVYKVPQDVEAEDKFLGPLSFKQFLLAGGALICLYMTYLMYTRGILPLAVIFFLPGVVFGFLAVPWSKEQPTEVWLAARIRFMIKPRRRIWDQVGMKNLVDITVPKREAVHYTDGLSQVEVRSRFNALASVIDTRGWAVKNAQRPTDRLTEGNIPVQTEMQAYAEQTPDVLDDKSSTIAQQFDTMIKSSEQRHRDQALQTMKTGQPQQQQQAAPAQQQDYWFLNQQQPADPSLATFQNQPVVSPGQATPAVTAQQALTADDTAALDTIHQRQQQAAQQRHPVHEKVIDPDGTATLPQPIQQAPVAPPPPPEVPHAEKQRLAFDNDKNISTIAREAERSTKKDDDPNEVVISLH